MNIKTILSSLSALILAAGVAGTTLHAADSSKPTAGEHAKIKKKTARKIALAKVPGGKIKEAELEKENGKLIWSFDIKRKGIEGITEVQVDAMTGDVVSVQKESAADEKKEKADEKEEKSEKK